MRVLHVVVSMDPAQGGPPAVAARLAAAQARMGHEVVLLSHEAPGREQEVQASLTTVPGFDRVRRLSLPHGVKLGLFIPTATRRALNAQMREAQVVHLHGLWEPLVRQAATEARRLNLPYILTPHGMLDPWSLRQRWLKKRIALALGYRRMLMAASFLHLLNADERALIAPLGLSTRGVIIPNGIFLEEIDPLPAQGAFRAARRELGERPYVLFLSRLHYKKGLDYLADAFAQVAASLGDVMLVVAGPDGGAQADFEERLAKHGIRDRCLIVGPLYGREKYAALVDAACFCLPSRQEGFSMAIIEALGCSLPVVISENCHFPEVATAGAGFITPLGAEAIADALARLLDDAALRQRMGAAGRRLVEEQFTWPKIAQQTVAVYQEALDNRSP